MDRKGVVNVCSVFVLNKKEEKKPKEQKKAPPAAQEDLYPVTFVLGQDYTRYYYY